MIRCARTGAEWRAKAREQVSLPLARDLRKPTQAASLSERPGENSDGGRALYLPSIFHANSNEPTIISSAAHAGSNGVCSSDVTR